MENGDLFGKLGLTNQTQRIKELRGANESDHEGKPDFMDNLLMLGSGKLWHLTRLIVFV